MILKYNAIACPLLRLWLNWSSASISRLQRGKKLRYCLAGNLTRTRNSEVSNEVRPYGNITNQCVCVCMQVRPLSCTLVGLQNSIARSIGTERSSQFARCRHPENICVYIGNFCTLVWCVYGVRVICCHFPPSTDSMKFSEQQ